MSDQIPEHAVPGVELRDPASALHPLEDLAHDRKGWTAIFEYARKQICGFIQCRDALEVLCKTATYHLVLGDKSSSGADKRSVSLTQADVEILHAIVLIHGDSKRRIPASPNSYQRFWPALSKMLFAFSRIQASGVEPNSDPIPAISSIRVHTIYYRNPLGGEDCRKTMRNILRRIDKISERDLGFRLSDAFEMLLSMIKTTEERLRDFFEHFHVLKAGTDEDRVERSIDHLRTVFPVAARLLALADRHDRDLKARAAVAFQVCDAMHSWIYTFKRADLLEDFGGNLTKFLDEIMIPVGGLSGNPEHIYMNNPIWARPLIGLTGGNLLFPEPYLPLSFPFRVFEPFIAKCLSGNKSSL